MLFEDLPELLDALVEGLRLLEALDDLPHLAVQRLQHLLRLLGAELALQPQVARRDDARALVLLVRLQDDRDPPNRVGVEVEVEVSVEREAKSQKSWARRGRQKSGARGGR